MFERVKRLLGGLKKFIFTKKTRGESRVTALGSDPAPLPTNGQSPPGSPEADNRTADDFFDPPKPKQVFKDAPPKDSLPPVPPSVKDGAVALFKSSFLGRWYYERRVVKETGMTTRQRIKRYDAMHDGESDTDTTTLSGKVSKANGETSP